MTDRLRSALRALIDRIDRLLPMSPDDRARAEDDGRYHSAERKRPLRLRMLGKRGKGGFW